jgi:hypothetical protein
MAAKAIRGRRIAAWLGKIALATGELELYSEISASALKSAHCASIFAPSGLVPFRGEADSVAWVDNSRW